MTAVLDALEAKLRADPNDWPSWLVFADWLLDQGDARGELITLEYELDTKLLPTRKRHEYVKRIAAIDREHRSAWLDGLALPPGAAPVWRNGFVVGMWSPVTFQLLDTIGTWHAHRTARFLGALDVTESGLQDADLTALLACDALSRFSSLRLRDNQIGDAEAARIADASTLDGLCTLDLSDNPIGPDGARALASGPWHSLRELELDRCPIGDEGAVSLAGSAFLPSLRRLHLRSAGIGSAGAEALAASATELERLRLAHDPIGTAGLDAWVRSRSWASLRWVDLHDTSISSFRALLAPHDPPLQHLQLLDVSGNAASDTEAVIEACRTIGCKTSA